MLVYPNKNVYVENYVSHDVRMVKSMSIPIPCKKEVRVYIHLRSEFKNGKYVKDDISIPEDPAMNKGTKREREETTTSRESSARTV